MSSLIVTVPQPLGDINSPEDDGDAQGYFPDLQYAFYTKTGNKPTQEDTITRCELTSADFVHAKSPFAIGLRLWTALKELDRPEDKTCSTTVTVFDGENLITATLGDAVTFAVVYDPEGVPSHVVRLNSVVRKPSDRAERTRTGLNLAVSRSLGDSVHRGSGPASPKLVSSDAQIDVTSISDLLRGMNRSQVGNIQIISTPDGFTNGAQQTETETQIQLKIYHQTYLKRKLETLKQPQGLADLPKNLANQAFKDRSRNNISVAVQNIDLNSPRPFLLGTFDGHNGARVSTYAAQNIAQKFLYQLMLPESVYASQATGVYQNIRAYQRNNCSAIVPPEAAPAEEVATVTKTATAIVRQRFPAVQNALAGHTQIDHADTTATDSTQRQQTSTIENGNNTSHANPIKDILKEFTAALETIRTNPLVGSERDGKALIRMLAHYRAQLEVNKNLAAFKEQCTLQIRKTLCADFAKQPIVKKNTLRLA
jgi:integrin-linked kinase-associated serine/threonine phosphatase 2C